VPTISSGNAQGAGLAETDESIASASALICRAFAPQPCFSPAASTDPTQVGARPTRIRAFDNAAYRVSFEGLQTNNGLPADSGGRGFLQSSA